MRTRLLLLALESRETPATFSVTNLNDSGGGSLRQAITDANTTPGHDFVAFQAGLTGTIVLTSGELAILDTVDVVGPGASALTVSGNNASRIFNTTPSPAGTIIGISGLTLTAGQSKVEGGGALCLGDEGMNLDDCVLTGNKVGDVGKSLSGGAVYVNGGELFVHRCTISGNTATGPGGGICFVGT